MTSAKILIVDDEPQIRRVLKSALTREGYIALEARTGEEALVKLRESLPDVILLDMNMPGMGGLATCAQIRETSEAAIIMLTVRNLEMDKVMALDAGADDFVTKPFSTPELLARIRASLRRLPSSTEAGGVITFDEVQVNLSSHELRVRGDAVRLTPKEFELLRYFLLNPDVPIPHAKLLQAVWGPDYGDQVEYLHVFTNQLRKKIEPDPSRPRYLVTEPRVGYRFRFPKDNL